MTAAFVLDCSLTMTWCFRDEATPAGDALLQRLKQETAVVPPLWLAETANVLAAAERRQRITPAQSSVFLAGIRTLEIEVDDRGHEFRLDDVLPLCRLYGLSGYDATYLALALRRRLPLATRDKPLRAAAEKAGVTVLGE